MLSWARQQNHVLPVAVGMLGAFLTLYAVVNHGWIVGTIVASTASLLLYLEIVTQLSFRAPRKRKEPLTAPNWKRVDINVGGYDIAHYVRQGQTDKPLAWVCHGWTSGAVRMIHRSSSFIDRGWNVVLVDLPSHGASASLPKWSAEQSTSLLIAAMNRLQQQQPEMFSHGVCYYGHSIGAFIGLRISKRRGELSENARPGAWIFESPMTGYTEIHDETCNLLKIPTALRPWVLRKTLAHFNAINGPERTVRSLSDADVPTWGIPAEATLMVQANPDERLGSIHHRRLIKAMSDTKNTSILETHLLDDLRHSGSHESDSRKTVVDAWLDEHFDYSSSV